MFCCSYIPGVERSSGAYPFAGPVEKNGGIIMNQRTTRMTSKQLGETCQRHESQTNWDTVAGATRGWKVEVNLL